MALEDVDIDYSSTCTSTGNLNSLQIVSYMLKRSRIEICNVPVKEILN